MAREYPIMLSLRVDQDTIDELKQLTKDDNEEENRSELMRCLIHKEYDKKFNNSVATKIKRWLERSQRK
ncbi:MAG: ribbon-helix-helix protein, CopG family [Kosmotogaceae bacterium]